MTDRRWLVRWANDPRTHHLHLVVNGQRQVATPLAFSRCTARKPQPCGTLRTHQKLPGHSTPHRPGGVYADQDGIRLVGDGEPVSKTTASNSLLPCQHPSSSKPRQCSAPGLTTTPMQDWNESRAFTNWAVAMPESRGMSQCVSHCAEVGSIACAHA